MAELNYRQQAQRLTAEERERMQEIVAMSERLLLVRSEVLLLLKRHGIDVAHPLRVE
ncbi:MAG: hypothetical protein U0531_20255 [Dehalococcoidia bacterium]